MKVSDGSSFGGYTSTSWNCSDVSHRDDKAFLFRFTKFTSTASGPEKFSLIQNKYSTFNHCNLGPTFGAGHDLVTFNTSGIQMTCSPNSYNSFGPLIGTSPPKQAHNFHLEVLQVSSTPANMTAELEEPWMAGCSWTTEVDHCAPLATCLSMSFCL